MKRLFDLVLAIILLIILGIPLIILILVAKFSIGGTGIFKQNRIGKKGIPFTIYKLQTFNINQEKLNKTGVFLRKYKLDELPQLVNIIKGEMSFVGPRPDIKGYADELEGEYKKILNLRPGITGPASLKYYKEEKLLKNQKNPKKYNDQVIFPDKVKINLDYYYNRTFFGDIKILLKTIFKVISSR